MECSKLDEGEIMTDHSDEEAISLYISFILQAIPLDDEVNLKHEILIVLYKPVY